MQETGAGDRPLMSDLLAARQAHAQLEGQLMAAKVAALKQKQKHQHEVSVQAADMDRQQQHTDRLPGHPGHPWGTRKHTGLGAHGSLQRLRAPGAGGCTSYAGSHV
jgi:hypothetical protein